MQRPRNIVVFTECYPFRSITEEVFVAPDLVALSKAFDKVCVVPLVRQGEQLPIGLSNVEVDTSLAYSRMQHSRLRKLLLSLHPFVLRHSLRSLSEAKSVRQWLKAHFYCINCVSIAAIASRLLKRRGFTAADTLLYTFWFLNTTSALCRLARRGGWRVVARAHNHDVFENSLQDVFISPHLRRYTLRHLCHVYPVSADAEDYLRSRYPAYRDKIQLRLIGSAKAHPGVNPASPDSDTITVLSVSRIVPVKRVALNLMVMQELAAANPQRRFRWIHVGDGELSAELRSAVEASKQPNLSVELRRAMPNVEVQRIYASQPIDLFMLLSTIEGLPIAICEALSYGVPVVATDVGGNREVVTPATGLLTDVDTPANAIAARISALLRNPQQLQAMRRAAHSLWQSNLNAETLRLRFAHELCQL